MNARFTKRLLEWDERFNFRQMPWKGEKDPYRIWLSEIILQQTRVEQGWAYYEKFIQHFPDIKSLAAAPDQQVFKLWEGLGYYSRCRNLLFTARLIAEKYNGLFPSVHKEVLALKGVGPYTAAAICSFAYNAPHAVVDGNVERVLSRYYGIETPIDSTAGKKQFTELAQSLLPHSHSAKFNQAIMDFGAVLCKPQQPLCSTCLLKKDCVAFKTNRQQELPVKNKSIKLKDRWFYFYLAKWRGKYYIAQRTGKDIWSQLYQFPLVESSKELKEKFILKAYEQYESNADSFEQVHLSKEYHQKLSHQHIHVRFSHLLYSSRPSLPADYKPIAIHELEQYPFPILLKNYIGTATL